MKKIKVKIDADDEFIPTYASEFASGADLKAFISEEVIIDPKQVVLIPTGIRLEIPPGFEVQIRPRSGLALKNHITVLNTPGTIDADYRGEVKVILINLGNKPFIVLPKMRIAQMVLMPIFMADFVSNEKLSLTDRLRGGFGHTGSF